MWYTTSCDHTIPQIDHMINTCYCKLITCIPQIVSCSSEPSPHCVWLSQRNSTPIQSLPSRQENWEEWHWTGGGGYAAETGGEGEAGKEER